MNADTVRKVVVLLKEIQAMAAEPPEEGRVLDWAYGTWEALDEMRPKVDAVLAEIKNSGPVV